MFPLIAYFIGNNSSQPDLFNYAEHEIVECGTDNGRNTWTGSTNIVCFTAWPRKSEDTIQYLEICLENNLIALFKGITSLMTKINGLGIIKPLRLCSLNRLMIIVQKITDSNPGRPKLKRLPGFIRIYMLRPMHLKCAHLILKGVYKRVFTKTKLLIVYESIPETL